MDRANVDTDQIIPKQFLKRIERTGFGQYLFFDWRFLDNGQDNPEFELNQRVLKVRRYWSHAATLDRDPVENTRFGRSMTTVSARYSLRRSLIYSSATVSRTVLCRSC